MSGMRKRKFRSVDGAVISDVEHADDYGTAPVFERARTGRLCLYYRDFLKKYCVPYDYIDRVYTKTITCPENEFANNEEYYKLMLIHDGNEFAELVLQRRKTVEALYEELSKQNSSIVFGTAE